MAARWRCNHAALRPRPAPRPPRPAQRRGPRVAVGVRLSRRAFPVSCRGNGGLSSGDAPCVPPQGFTGTAGIRLSQLRAVPRAGVQQEEVSACSAPIQVSFWCFFTAAVEKQALVSLLSGPTFPLHLSRSLALLRGPMDEPLSFILCRNESGRRNEMPSVAEPSHLPEDVGFVCGWEVFGSTQECGCKKIPCAKHLYWGGCDV